MAAKEAFDYIIDDRCFQLLVGDLHNIRQLARLYLDEGQKAQADISPQTILPRIYTIAKKCMPPIPYHQERYAKLTSQHREKTIQNLIFLHHLPGEREEIRILYSPTSIPLSEDMQDTMYELHRLHITHQRQENTHFYTGSFQIGFWRGESKLWQPPCEFPLVEV